MRYWTGAAFFAVGVVLLVMAARRRRTGALAAPSSAMAGMAAFGEIMRPIVLGFIGFLALKMTMVFAMMGAGRVFAPIDFAGFLFALASYGAWFWIATKYRLPARAPAAVAAVARERDDVGGFGALRVAAVRTADRRGGDRRARLPETVE